MFITIHPNLKGFFYILLIQFPKLNPFILYGLSNNKLFFIKQLLIYTFHKPNIIQELQFKTKNALKPQMRIISMHVLKWQQQNSLFITSAYELGFASWYQRPFVKQQLNFGARTAANRSKIGQRIAISLPQAQAKCYLVIDKEGIAYAVLADDEYPERIVNLILRKMANDFKADFQTGKFAKMEKDQNVTWKKLQENIKKYQDPKQVDKLEKLKGELKEVQEICHKNMNDLLKRGEDLDNLMEKSKDVSKMSYDFYQTAKKANKRCCSLY